MLAAVAGCDSSSDAVTGSAAAPPDQTLTLDAVVETYNTRKALGLTVAQKADLVEYLKSL
jgi:hypothetical protein